MLFLVFSDIHGNLNVAKKIVDISMEYQVDFIVGCGDFEEVSILRLINDHHDHFLSIPGNVDGPSVLQAMEKLNINLHGRLVQVNSLFIGGIGGYKMNLFLPRLVAKLEEVKPKKWILITHFPPKNTAADRFFIGFHVGNSKIKYLVKKFKPIACFCGHVHESPCISFHEDILIVNPGPAFRWRAALVNLKNMTAIFIDLK